MVYVLEYPRVDNRIPSPDRHGRFGFLHWFEYFGGHGIDVFQNEITVSMASGSVLERAGRSGVPDIACSFLGKHAIVSGVRDCTKLDALIEIACPGKILQTKCRRQGKLEFLNVVAVGKLIHQAFTCHHRHHDSPLLTENRISTR